MNTTLCKHWQPAPFGTHQATVGPFVCYFCENERLQEEIKGLRDNLDAGRAELVWAMADGKSYQAECERLRAGLAAADALAHQYIFTPFHERYWQARGGHDACTVCEPAEAAICACGEPKDPKADCCLNCYALHDSEEATSDTRE